MAQLPFIPNRIYNRRADIHAKYGGNWQNGISTSASFPYIFIFSGKTGRQHGYFDKWLNPNVFEYTGEGQRGHMKLAVGNLALKNHLQDGKRVFLFEIEDRGVRFISEMEYQDLTIAPNVPDREGKLRDAIIFFLKRKGTFVAKPYGMADDLAQVAEPGAGYASKPPNKTERKGLVTSRVGQGIYRKEILYRWENRCAVTGFNKKVILIASHIVPWAESTDLERRDVHNGILLSPTYDALFDRHLISFENSGKIILSDAIEAPAYQKIGVTGKEKIKNFSINNQPYLERHRIKFNGTH